MYSGIDLGSDHYILRIDAELPGKKQREYKLIDWDKFRAIRTQPSNSTGANTKHTITSWTKQLKADIVASERTITTDAKVETMDSRLANLLEAKQSILARWKGQRFNRRLRRKLAELNKTIEEYCVVLSRQQWDEVCNSLNGQIRRASGWRLIKHLLDENGTNSKTKQRISLSTTRSKAVLPKHLKNTLSNGTYRLNRGNLVAYKGRTTTMSQPRS